MVDRAVTAESRCLLRVLGLGSLCGRGMAVPRALVAAWAEPCLRVWSTPVAALLSCHVWAAVWTAFPGLGSDLFLQVCV